MRIASGLPVLFVVTVVPLGRTPPVSNMTPRAPMNERGSTYPPPSSVLKCRCGPVESPVVPTAPTTAPLGTVCPADTEMADICPYCVASPPPWSMATKLPYPSYQPACVTRPCAAAHTGRPVIAARSMPEWSCVPDPVGFCR